MNLCLGILAHEGGAETIRDFEPQWKKLGIPMVTFMPEGQKWPGWITQVHHFGIGGHDAPALYDRFQNACEVLLTFSADLFILSEYDVVNLTANMAKCAYDPSSINCGLMKTWGGEVPNGDYYICMPPWLMTRPMLAAAIEAMNMQRRARKYEHWISGLLDRWLAVAFIEAGLPVSNLDWVCPYAPHEAPKPNAQWVHGWKRKEQFGNLWPQS